MTAFNTKLTKDEKADLRMIREDQKDVEIVSNGKTTIAYKKLGNGMRQFSTASCHASETKYRAKVGEYYARCRFENNEKVILSASSFKDLLYALEMEEN